MTLLRETTKERAQYAHRRQAPSLTPAGLLPSCTSSPQPTTPGGLIRSCAACRPRPRRAPPRVALLLWKCPPALGESLPRRLRAWCTRTCKGRATTEPRRASRLTQPPCWHPSLRCALPPSSHSAPAAAPQLLGARSGTRGRALEAFLSCGRGRAAKLALTMLPLALSRHPSLPRRLAPRRPCARWRTCSRTTCTCWSGKALARRAAQGASWLGRCWKCLSRTPAPLRCAIWSRWWCCLVSRSRTRPLCRRRRTLWSSPCRLRPLAPPFRCIKRRQPRPRARRTEGASLRRRASAPRPAGAAGRPAQCGPPWTGPPLALSLRCPFLPAASRRC